MASVQLRRSLVPLLRPARTSTRPYATQTSLGTTGRKDQPRHKRVTVFNDDGRVSWGQLTTGEKIARTTQQSFNFSIIAVGALATAGIFFLLYSDVFSSESPTRMFDRAVDRIKKDPSCTDLLGPTDKITAYGDGYWTTWVRHRPLHHRVETDKAGTQRLYMHWNMQGPLNEGVVRLYMLKRQGETEFSYGHLALDIRGHQRVYLENVGDNPSKKTPGTLFGIRWTR